MNPVYQPSNRESDEVSQLKASIAQLKHELIANEVHDLFFTHSLDMLCILSLDGHFKTINPRFIDTLEYSEEELNSYPFLHFVHPEDLDLTIANLDSLSKTSSSLSFVSRFMFADGSFRIVQWDCSSNVQLQEIYITAHDITELRVQEEQRQALGDMIESLHIAVLIYELSDSEDPRSFIHIAANKSAHTLLKDFNLEAGSRLAESFHLILTDELLATARNIALGSYEQGSFIHRYKDDKQGKYYNITIHPLADKQIAIFLEDVTQQVLAEEAQHQSLIQNEIIRMQQLNLEELSTPLIPITDEITIMPLIGSMDTRRVQRVMETLLTGISQTRANTVIIDITGVPMVDTQVADVLIRAADAVRLLGATAMITGIRPEVAQTLIGLGVDLSGLQTLGSLQSGIALALNKQKQRTKRS
jgi:rsbT co-antagonist protein RsbR